MRRMILLVLLVCSYGFTFAHKEEVTRIEDRPLTWDDYKGSPKSGGPIVALTHSRIQLDSVDFKDDGTIPVFHATCYFMPDRSWVDHHFLSESNADEKEHILQHEQTHYNIARIAADEINRVMNSFPYDKNNIIGQADSIFRSMSAKLRLVQTTYDEQTSHSQRYEEQAAWNKLISDCMVTKRLPDLQMLVAKNR